MPLFLNTISSTLVADILDADGYTRSSVFVFSGFCLLAGISSRAFIEKLSDRILQDLEDTKKKALETRTGMENIEQAIAPFVEGVEPSTPEVDSQLQALTLTQVDRRVLESITHDRYTMRSVQGLTSQVGGISEDDVRMILLHLQSMQLVRKVSSATGDRWSLAELGQRWLDVN
jgi:hypothetical protein